MDIIEKINSHGLLLDGAMGSMLAPAGAVSFEEMKEHFACQAQILDQEGVDLFLVETVFDLNAGLCAVQAIQSVSRKPVFCTLTFKETPKGFFTIFGNGPEHSMKALADHGAAAVGANCSLGTTPETIKKMYLAIQQPFRSHGLK
jgi:methionine synthase I (cobalamin-dependent)